MIITLPTLHAGQVDIWQHRSQYNVVSCGRRFGKTKLLTTIAASAALKGKQAGVFTPTYKQLEEIWQELIDILHPLIRQSSKNEGTIRLKTGGKLDFWACIDNPLVGRGRAYNVALMDEAAFLKSGESLLQWSQAIAPTLLTTKGSAWMFSTPNGIDPEGLFYQAWHDETLGFKKFHAPSIKNPYVPPEELEKIRAKTHPTVFQQEYLAEFLDFGSSTFFKLEYLLQDGQPVPAPERCWAVFAVMDCAMKSGSDNDATAVTYFAFNRHAPVPLVVLDWDFFSIDAAMLDQLTPQVIEKCEQLADQHKARSGSLGVFVEDAAGGTLINQWAKTRGWPVHKIDSKLQQKGKDERALTAGNPVYQGSVKFSEYAYNKQIDWKGRVANHLLQQITLFRMGDKDAKKRADDGLDTFTYGVILALVEGQMMV